MPSRFAHDDETRPQEGEDAPRHQEGEAGRPAGGNAPEDRPDEPEDRPDEPEDRPDEPGAEGGSKSPAADTPPGAPSDDESAVGDTDQHSTG